MRKLHIFGFAVAAISVGTLAGTAMNRMGKPAGSECSGQWCWPADVKFATLRTFEPDGTSQWLVVNDGKAQEGRDWLAKTVAKAKADADAAGLPLNYSAGAAGDNAASTDALGVNVDAIASAGTSGDRSKESKELERMAACRVQVPPGGAVRVSKGFEWYEHSHAEGWRCAPVMPCSSGIKTEFSSDYPSGQWMPVACAAGW